MASTRVWQACQQLMNEVERCQQVGQQQLEARPSWRSASPDRLPTQRDGGHVADARPRPMSAPPLGAPPPLPQPPKLPQTAVQFPLQLSSPFAAPYLQQIHMDSSSDGGDSAEEEEEEEEEDAWWQQQQGRQQWQPAVEAQPAAAPLPQPSQPYRPGLQQEPTLAAGQQLHSSPSLTLRQQLEAQQVALSQQRSRQQEWCDSVAHLVHGASAAQEQQTCLHQGAGAAHAQSPFARPEVQAAQPGLQGGLQKLEQELLHSARSMASQGSAASGSHVSRLLSVAQELGILQTPHSTLDSQPSWATPSGGTSAASPAGSRQPSGGARPPARRSEETEQATAHTRAQGRWGGQPQHVQPAWLGEQPVPPLPMPPSHWLQQAAPPQGPPGFAWAQQPVPGGAPRAPGPPPGWAERLEPPQPLRPIVTHRPAVGRQAEQHQAAAPARQADHQASHMKLLWLTQQQKLAQQRAEQQAFVEAAQRLLGQRG